MDNRTVTKEAGPANKKLVQQLQGLVGCLFVSCFWIKIVSPSCNDEQGAGREVMWGAERRPENSQEGRAQSSRE